MKKFYQTEWLGIPFESFITISSEKLAGVAFYKSFYNAFFKKYQNVDQLDPSWVKLKLQAAHFLMQHNKFKKGSRILSIGCGLGVIEQVIIKEGYSNLEITEVSKEPLEWLLPHISPANIHIGLFPDCLPPNHFYDVIYLSSVEYVFDQDQFIDFLKAVKKYLLPGGICLMISWSFEYAETLQKLIIGVKDLLKFILDKIGLRSRGQFWGYLRNQKDFYHVMTAAGFVQIHDGMFEKKTRWDTYWIEGSTSEGHWEMPSHRRLHHGEAGTTSPT